MTTFAEKDGFIWFDGQVIDWKDAKVHVLTHTLHYGLGVFEGVRAYKKARKDHPFYKDYEEKFKLTYDIDEGIVKLFKTKVLGLDADGNNDPAADDDTEIV